MNNTVTPSTYVRNLGPGLFRKLADFLDPQDGWKTLATAIQKASGEPRYTQLHIRRFEGSIQKGKSPTQELLYDLGTTNCTVRDLTDILRKNHFLTAASVLLCDQETSSACPTIPIGELEKKQTTPEKCSQTNHGNPVCQSIDPEENDEETVAEEVRKQLMNCELITKYKKNNVLKSSMEITKYNQLTLLPMGENQRNTPDIIENEPLKGFGIFSFNELKRITRNFDDRPLSQGGNKIGEGGFGVVFQGQLKSEKVAVKKLTIMVDSSLQDLKDQFDQEIKTMARCQHENIVKLLGFANDGDHYCLVYTYMSNGSVLDRLACLNNTAPLSWNKRCNISVGTAKGIKYLHENNHTHRDIKSANILLDAYFTPKISDFGLARATGQHARTMMTERIVGTTAYMAPEALRGEVTIKSDIFSFGVVLLEVISGLPPFEETRDPSLLLDIKEEIEEEEKTLEECVDKKMGDVEFSLLEKMYGLASQCLNQMKNKRPTIITVLHTLEDITYSSSGS